MRSIWLDMDGGHGQILEGFRYDVFLSFHGKDTRTNFTDHLYHALRKSDINTFRDDQKLPKGGVISSELRGAIKSSKILLVVFSKNYASSTWCLNELLHIMKCSKQNSRQLVFPIFLDIEPSDVRRQKGTVAESFAKHESRFQSSKLQNWKDALTTAANLSGWDLRGRHEAEGIDEVVKEILTKLQSSYLHIVSHPVGLTPRLDDLYSLLSMGSDDVRVVGICGMGGIGKTTIAKAAYNKFSHLFEIKSFLANFREFSKKPDGKNQLWQQGHTNIDNRHDNEAQKSLHKKSALLVIDDVESFDQFNYEAIDRNHFGRGSRIIVTSRDEHLLKQLGANDIYVLRNLEKDESLELFSCHAFRACEPPNEFLVLSGDVIEYCEGLPLAIEVLGAFLFRRDTQQWKETLNLLKRIPNDKIQEKLRISFNALSKEEKDIFLDIACFFIGMDKDYVRDILDGCGFSSDLGLRVLKEKCLVTFYDNKLMMHGLIRDMGREIVREEFPNNLGKRSRLWDAEDVTDLLINGSGTDAVEGLSLKAHGLDIGKLDAKSFSKLTGLRFLQVSHIQLSESYQDFPKGLKSLCWHGFASKFIPKNLFLRKLAFMDMRFSKLVQLWEEPMLAQNLKKLKFLDLSYSLGLRETPDFSYLPNLEKLLLAGCKSLVLVHESIGILRGKLVLVNVRDCSELEGLPASFYKLKSLETLNISGCSKLKKMDDALGKMEALQTLHADCKAIREIPSLTVRLKKLEKLSLSGSYGPIPKNLRGDNGPLLEGGYHGVFLSHYRKDACKKFVDDLYHALRNSGIHAFRDDDEQPRKFMGSELQEAIESSKILIVVFSKNYLSSTLCLDELQHIMKCSKSNLQQIVFPVFHNIEPLDIQKHKGTVAELFAQHERYFPLEKVQSWRDALTAAGNLSGLDSRNKHEADCIQDIINEIVKMLDGFYLHVASYPVHIRSRLLVFSRLLDVGSEDIRVVGIWGMGGVGKTTIAKAIYNEFSHAFEGRSFLPQFSEFSESSEGRNYLIQKLLFDILKRHDIEDHAVKVILRQKRVLVVVDDIDDVHQFNHVFKDLNWFGPGSRIIVTSRDKHCLMVLGAKDLFETYCLSIDESLELFSQHAFRTNEPPEEFLRLSRNLVHHCSGLPLALTVLGASLLERSLLEWKRTCESFQGILYERVGQVLQTALDALSSEQRDILLDIACFFNGMDKDYVRYILDGCGYSPDIGLSVLKERCLVTTYDNKIMMHALIQEMGREIVREKSRKNYGKLSRFWYTRKGVDVLTQNSGTEAVEGLSLKAQSLDGRNLDAKLFSTLQELRLLQLSHVQVEGSYEHFPKGLKWLYWHGFPLEFIPANFYLRRLVVMDMQYSNLRRLWKVSEAQHLQKLKFLDLSYSLWLRETPDFSYLPNLEKLLLTGCKSLVFVHETINILSEKLVLVNLRDCIELEDLPANFYKLKSLETLVILGCSKLKKLDDALQQMEALTTLLAENNATKETTSQLSCLLPASLEGSASCLRTLCLSYCSLRDETIPKDLRSLPYLEELDLRGNNFHNLQVDFASLLNLGLLRLDNCSRLQSILCLPGSLKYFYATDCVSLERTPDVSVCSSLQSLHLTNCNSLVETPGLVKLKTLRVVCMERCYRLADTFKDSILQAVSGYGGIFLPGSRLPSWFTSCKPQQRSISFTVPENFNRNLAGFTLCICYSSRLENVRSEYFTNIKVTNHTKGSTWRSPRTVNILMCRERHLWQGHLSTEDLPFEAGDRLEGFVNFGDQVTLLEIGVAFVCREKECYANSGHKAAIGYADASDKPITISVDKDSADEIQDELHSTETQDELGVSGNFHEEAGEDGMADDGDFSESTDNETIKDIFTVTEQSSAPEVLRYQEKSSRADKESRQRPLRNMRPVLWTFLGALGFFTFAVAWQILANRGGASSLLRKKKKDKDSQNQD